ncbi:MAG TPA: MurR/RpiR family transcriptional regulator [Candidatus Egerieicola faecale]|uniref:MurR/RpiR family transcriptional regulator n=1 Tax=Candidatus Egerieicola faecale TaxID=2840774 RepID=A0A9D1ISB2_9FIRM|nr:MurR/RpiR family transcriptional regulator [Candidatus Egerieicola faecale]
MSTDLLGELKQRYNQFSKSQRRIADYILEHYSKAAYLTAARLGQQAQVSESTVVRFAFELGFDGYPALQAALQETVRSKLTSLQRMEVAGDRQEEGEPVLDQVLNKDVEQIYRTLEQTDRAAFAGAVESIHQAKTVYLLASGSAAFLAGFLNFYFRLVLPNVRLIQSASASELFEQILRVGKGDIVIGISFPRYSKKTVNALRYARKNGAQVVAITDSEFSPLAAQADYLLLARSDMVSFADSLVAPLSLINALIAAVGQRRQEETRRVFDRLEEIWAEYDVYAKAEEADGI